MHPLSSTNAVVPLVFSNVICKAHACKSDNFAHTWCQNHYQVLYLAIIIYSASSTCGLLCQFTMPEWRDLLQPFVILHLWLHRGVDWHQLWNQWVMTKIHLFLHWSCMLMLTLYCGSCIIIQGSHICWRSSFNYTHTAGTYTWYELHYYNCPHQLCTFIQNACMNLMTSIG